MRNLLACFSVFLAASVLQLGCAQNNNGRTPGEQVVWHTDPKSTPSCCSVSFAQTSDSEFRVEVRNETKGNVYFPVYYFGFSLSVTDSQGRKALFDYGADKVPVPSDGDWHILRPQQSIAWNVTVPRSFPQLSQAREVTYRQGSMKPNPPKWIQTLSERGDQVIIQSRWTR